MMNSAQQQLERSQNWDSLSATAKTILEPIAQACPSLDGPAVEKARAIIYEYTGKRYFNKCEGHTRLNNIQKRLKNGVATDENANKLAVYPNPANNRLTIEISLAKQNANFKLYDLSGKLMLHQQLTNGVNAVPLKELKKGMYIYRIKDAVGKELKTDKLILQ